MPPLQDLTGKIFGRLLVVERAENDSTGHVRWRCECECGKITVVSAGSLKRGSTKSCGCLHSELASQQMFKHGGAHTRLYSSWNSMIHRCESEKSTSYSHYGGRGISVCEEWHDFERFRAWALNNEYSRCIEEDRQVR